MQFLPKVVARRQRRVDHAQVFAQRRGGFDLDMGLAVAQGLLFHRVAAQALVAGVAGAELLADGRAAYHAQVAHRGEFLDLVQKNVALAHGAGNHHAGESGHGHFVHAVGQVLRLLHRDVAADAGFPGNQPAPGQDQAAPYRHGQFQPDWPIGKFAHACADGGSVLLVCL
ncbi:hypothetical protein [Chromobacterium haemolyticum]|uniref:hypothetical protein n=1 Tax=Chromobacterium haemolyticum TaxID=394935 RepID=UPI001131F122|nr:hypothetical protein [Chromobacterium haemolyticum]